MEIVLIHNQFEFKSPATCYGFHDFTTCGIASSDSFRQVECDGDLSGTERDVTSRNTILATGLAGYGLYGNRFGGSRNSAYLKSSGIEFKGRTVYTVQQGITFAAFFHRECHGFSTRNIVRIDRIGRYFGSRSCRARINKDSRDGQTTFSRHHNCLRASRIFDIIDNQFRQFIIGRSRCCRNCQRDVRPDLITGFHFRRSALHRDCPVRRT
ncbi:unknown [Parabacteroides johnsonii CAG:246]|nr:unknown [Parabacteroides johnsonii CAG:246]